MKTTKKTRELKKERVEEQIHKGMDWAYSHQDQGYREKVECEEPGCRFLATMDWNGRKVCADHYDRFRDAWFSLFGAT